MTVEFTELVRRMRAAEKAYDATPTYLRRDEKIRLEKLVDAELAKIKAPEKVSAVQGGLF